MDFDLNSPKRQCLVNYLVHLEGIAALVNDGVLGIDAINDLMAYRYFLAVNNPIVQEIELFPYRKFYQGCFKLYNDWSKKLGTDVPMREKNMLKQAKLYEERMKEAEITEKEKNI